MAVNPPQVSLSQFDLPSLLALLRQSQDHGPGVAESVIQQAFNFAAGSRRQKTEPTDPGDLLRSIMLSFHLPRG